MKRLIVLLAVILALLALAATLQECGKQHRLSDTPQQQDQR